MKNGDADSDDEESWGSDEGEMKRGSDVFDKDNILNSGDHN